MTQLLKGNMLIAQSGGPSMVINRSLVGAIQEAKKHKEIQGIYGSLHGIKGVLEEKMIDLRKESKANLEAVAVTPSSALGSVRKKPTEEECLKIFGVMLKYNIRYFFYIGGNDSAETTHIVNEHARKINYDFRGFHIPKTIDNDLLENDHTPGFGSAAKFVACAVMGGDLDNRALPGVKIDVVMGRHAGWVALYTAIATAADFVCIPERKIDTAQMIKKLKEAYARKRFALVVTSEAAELPEAGEDSIKHEVDQFGHRILKDRGMGEHIARFIEKETGIETRVSVIGHMQRGGAPTLFDRMLATRVGMKAADLVHAGEFGMMSALVGNQIVGVPLEKATGELKVVSKEWFDIMEVLF